MDLGTAIRVLLRRWLVVVIGLVLTLGVGAYLYTTSPPSYQSTARMLLLLPSDARGTDESGSPFLYLPSGLNVLARLVAVAPQSREFRAEMIAQGYTPAYEVGVDPTTPIITVSVEGPDPDNVRESRDKLTEAVAAELLRVQEEEGAPPKQIAHARIYAAEEVPEELSGSGLRGVLALAAVGGLLTLIAAFAVDRVSYLREQRRLQRASGAEPDEDHVPEHATTEDGNAEPEEDRLPEHAIPDDADDQHSAPDGDDSGADETRREQVHADGDLR